MEGRVTPRGGLSHLVVPGREITVRVTPGAARTTVEEVPAGLRVRVTAPPEAGKANAAVREALARALGIAKGRLTLVRGGTSRIKVWRVD
ncbi:DUF167 domain-containing protein [Palleronia sp. KMU-117]|uniref:DUF167 domain-containing protein n=1 Tax=Palleronia sp. KMU-117 TaxID=3434108 RepID=UPI003D747155